MTASLPEPAPRFARLVLLTSAVGIAVGAVVGILMPAGLGWDFANFYDTGGRILHGQVSDLYDATALVGGEEPQGQLDFWGTPISSLLYVPLALLPPYPALVVFKLLNTVAMVGGVVVVYRWLRRRVGTDPADQWTFAAIVAGLTLLFQPFWTIYRVGGQTTPFVFLMLCLAFVAYAQDRTTRASVLLIGVAVLKPAFVFVPAWLFLVSGKRFGAKLAAVGLASVALSVVALGWEIHAEFVQIMLDGLRTGSVAWQNNSSLYVVFENVRWLPQYADSPELLEPLKGALITGLKLLVLGTIVTLRWRSRDTDLGPSDRRELDFILALLVFLLVSEILWEHYLAPLFLLMCHVWATRRHFRRGALVLMGAVSVSALWQNLILIEWMRTRIVMDTWGEAVALGLLKSAPLWLTLLLMWRHGHELLSSFRSPPEPVT